MAFITVLSIVVFTYFSKAEANSHTKSSCFPVPPENDLCKSINISCPLGSVIYKPNIVASSDDCPASGQFFQNTEPPCVGRPVDLYTDIADCYWKQFCLIKFPLTPIFTRTCVNQAQSTIVQDWICIKAAQNSVYFKDLICKSQFIGTHANSGVILSHQNIPWNYDRTMFDENQILKSEKTCETSITVPTAGGSRVLIEISLFDIDMQNDQLTINEIMVEKEDFRKEFPPYTQVNIKFSSKTDNSKGGKGFVICFRRLNKQEINEKSACDGIFEFGKDPKLTFDEDMQLEQGTIAPTEESTTALIQTTKPNPSTDQQCTKCLEKKRPKEKCKTLCCKGQVTHRQCQSQSSSTTTATPIQGKCKVKKKSRIDKLCKNCVKGKIKCTKKDNCYSCYPGKTVYTECRKGKGDRNRKRKGKKKKKTKQKKKDKNGS